jgi:hypothetical protein
VIECVAHLPAPAAAAAAAWLCSPTLKHLDRAGGRTAAGCDSEGVRSAGLDTILDISIDSVHRIGKGSVGSLAPRAVRNLGGGVLMSMGGL